MNWFERHLNWTILIVTFASILLFLILSIYIFDLYFSFRFRDVDRLFINNIIFIALGCNALTVLWYGWILRRKNQSSLFLLFFIPMFISIIVWLFQPIIDPDMIPILANSTVWLSLATYITGWLFILFLKDLSIQTDLSIPKPTFVYRLSNIRNIRKYVTIVIVIFLLTTSGFTYYRMEHSYKTFTGYKYLEIENPMYTFECHPCYFHPFIFDWRFGADVSITYLVRARPLLVSALIEQDIFIRVCDLSVFSSIQGNESLYKNIEYIKRTSPDVFEYDPSVEIATTSNILVNGISADYLILHITNQPYDFKFQGTLRAACFEHNGYVWVITMRQENIFTNKSDDTFSHLLKTFQTVD